MNKVSHKELLELKMKAPFNVHAQAKLSLAKLQNNHLLHVSEDSDDNIPVILQMYEELNQYVTDQEYIRRVHKHGHTNLIKLITQQLKDFYPNRVKDYESGDLQVNIYYLVDESDYEYFNVMRQQASITEPACVLIMGFNIARLFVGPVIMDIEASVKDDR